MPRPAPRESAIAAFFIAIHFLTVSTRYRVMKVCDERADQGIAWESPWQRQSSALRRHPRWCPNGMRSVDIFPGDCPSNGLAALA
jgi:hypothetical protein